MPERRSNARCFAVWEWSPHTALSGLSSFEGALCERPERSRIVIRYAATAQPFSSAVVNDCGGSPLPSYDDRPRERHVLQTFFDWSMQPCQYSGRSLEASMSSCGVTAFSCHGGETSRPG